MTVYCYDGCGRDAVGLSAYCTDCSAKRNRPALPGTTVGECPACRRWFTVDSAFDRHRAGPYSARVCLDPATVGLVERARAGYTVWGWPGDGDAFSRVKRSTETAERPEPAPEYPDAPDGDIR